MLLIGDLPAEINPSRFIAKTQNQLCTCATKIFVRNTSGPKSVWHRQTTFSAGLFCLYSVSCRNIPTSAGLVVSQSAHASSWLRCFLPFSANKFTDRSERNIDQSRSHSAYQYSSITNDCPWYLSASWVRRSNRWHFSPPLVPALRAKKAHPSLEWRSQDDEILKDIENISDNFDLSNLTPRPATGKFLLILSLVCLICGRHCTVKGFSLCVPLLYVGVYLKGVCSLLSVSSDPSIRLNDNRTNFTTQKICPHLPSCFGSSVTQKPRRVSRSRKRPLDQEGPLELRCCNRPARRLFFIALPGDAHCSTSTSHRIALSSGNYHFLFKQQQEKGSEILRLTRYDLDATAISIAEIRP